MNVHTMAIRLGIRAEDHRKLLLLTPIFLVCGIAEVLNYNGFMTLFNQRLGGSFLPYVYMAEAVILPFEAWLMSWLAGRLSKPALMKMMYVLLTGIVLANTIVLLVLRFTDIQVPLYFAVLFITSSFVVRQQSILLWSLAVDLCPTQQAKRLMPLFVSGATLGGVVGGLTTQLVSPFGADMIYMIGPVLLIVMWIPFRHAIARFLVPLTLKGAANDAQGEQSALTSADYFRRTLKSPFLLTMVGLMTIMPALFFLSEYIFVNTAHIHFPNEEDYGRMFGVVSTIMFVMAFLLQLVSGKLVARLGASGMLVGIAGVYIIAFGAAFLLFPTPMVLMAAAGSYMMINVLLYYMAEPSYQLFYKTVPLRERDGFRFVAQGVSAFLGALLGAGLQMLHSGLGWSFPALAVTGAGVSVLMLGLVLLVRHLYMRELVHSVRATDLSDLDSLESIGELERSGKVMAIVQQSLRHPDAANREMAVDIIGRTSDVRRYLPELLEGLSDPAYGVRRAALRAVDLSDADINAMVKVAEVLEDRDPDIRAEGVRKLAQMKHLPSQAFFFLRLKLVDEHPEVVAEAVKAMYLLESEHSYVACYEAIENIIKQGGEAAIPICRIVAELGLSQFADGVKGLLMDETHPAVRLAATSCLGLLKQSDVLPLLLERLRRADQELQGATIEAFVSMGEPVVKPLQDVLAEAPPTVWYSAVAALARLLPGKEVRAWLVERVLQRQGELEAMRQYAPSFEVIGRSDLAELAVMRTTEVQQTVSEASWRMLEELTDREVVSTVRRAIESPDDDISSGGLEVLAEGLGDQRLSRCLATAIQFESVSSKPSPEEAKERIAEAGGLPDDWWREMAEEADRGTEGNAVADEHTLLSRLNKVVYLKKVPFFANLSLEELGLIAAAASEERFPDGAFLLKRGERNAAMYVIVEGNVELSSVSAAGWEATMGILGPGEVCGATSALDESLSTVTAQAFFGEVRVLSLQHGAITRLIRLYPEIGLGLLHASLARVRQLEEMMMKIDG